jgi:hypothetical protein
MSKGSSPREPRSKELKMSTFGQNVIGVIAAFVFTGLSFAMTLA